MTEDNWQEGGGSAMLGGMRRAALVIGCGNSNLLARNAPNRSERGLDLSKVAIYQMAERHGRGEGTTGRRKQLLLQCSHRYNDVGAR